MRNLFVSCKCFYDELIGNLSNFEIVRRPVPCADNPELFNLYPCIDKEIRDSFNLEALSITIFVICLIWQTLINDT